MPSEAVPTPLKTERHHWWPRTLSKFWANDDGIAHCVSFDGDLLPSPPKSFGVIGNDNHILFSPDGPTVWDESFEKSYSKADSAFDDLIRWLQTLMSPIPASTAPFAERLSPFTLSDERHAMLAECLASLIVRSPNFRFRVRQDIESIRKDMGLAAPQADSSLIGMNVRFGQQTLSTAMAKRGKFAVLLSGESEFIFGDGFLHNISSIANPPLGPRCLIPLTPEIAVFYTRPGSYRSFPKAFVANLRPEEVAFVNRTVQIYATRFLFFRDIHPVIDPAFSQGKHLEIEGHRSSWLNALEDSIANGIFKGGQFQQRGD